jgi:hypothetical protein
VNVSDERQTACPHVAAADIWAERLICALGQDHEVRRGSEDVHTLSLSCRIRAQRRPNTGRNNGHQQECIANTSLISAKFWSAGCTSACRRSKKLGGKRANEQKNGMPRRRAVMAASYLEILWRNPLPIWARQVEQAAGSLELIKSPEPQRRPWSIGSIAFYCSRPRIGVAKLPQAVKSLVRTWRNGRAHAQEPQDAAGSTSSAVAVTATSARDVLDKRAP